MTRVLPKSLKGWKLAGRGGMTASVRKIHQSGRVSLTEELKDDEHTCITVREPNV